MVCGEWEYSGPFSGGMLGGGGVRAFQVVVVGCNGFPAFGVKPWKPNQNSNLRLK